MRFHPSVVVLVYAFAHTTMNGMSGPSLTVRQRPPSPLPPSVRSLSSSSVAIMDGRRVSRGPRGCLQCARVSGHIVQSASVPLINHCATFLHHLSFNNVHCQQNTHLTCIHIISRSFIVIPKTLVQLGYEPLPAIQ